MRAVTTLVAPVSGAATSGPAAVEVEGLRKSYGQIVAVDGVTFSVGHGEVFGLLGPNGAGKTTTVEMIEGLRQPDAGRIRVCGLDPIMAGEALKERIGVALQNSALYPKLKVHEIVQLWATFYARAVPADELIALMDLAEKRHAIIKTLSGGQRQRLALALALIHDPDVLFLDEPTAGLDPQARRGLWQVIARLRASGKTIVLTTHYMEEAESLCDRVAIIDSGKIIALDRPAALVDRYLSDETIVFQTVLPPDLDTLRALPAVGDVSLAPATGQSAMQTVRLRSSDAQASLRALLNTAAGGAHLRDLRVERATLEDVFLHLTGRRIRE